MNSIWQLSCNLLCRANKNRLQTCMLCVTIFNALIDGPCSVSFNILLAFLPLRFMLPFLPFLLRFPPAAINAGVGAGVLGVGFGIGLSFMLPFLPFLLSFPPAAINAGIGAGVLGVGFNIGLGFLLPFPPFLLRVRFSVVGAGAGAHFLPLLLRLSI